MGKRDQDYHLIAALHDQLEDLESYERYLEHAEDCEGCLKIWNLMKQRTEESVALIRQEIQSHVGR